MCFVNKLDRMGANFYRCVDMIVTRLGATPLVTQLPIGSESEFEGLIDLLKMQEIIWKDESLGAEFEYRDIRPELKEQAEEYHAKMVELAVEMDDTVMEAYLEGNEPDEATLKKLIRKGTITRKFVPVLCGSAFKNKPTGQYMVLHCLVPHQADVLPGPTLCVATAGDEFDAEGRLLNERYLKVLNTRMTALRDRVS